MQQNKPKVLASSALCLCGSWLVPLLAHAAPAAPAPAPAAPIKAPAPAPAAPAEPRAAPSLSPVLPDAPAAAPAAPPGASPAAPSGAPAAPPEAASPSPAAIAEAKQRFDRGLELYSEGEYPLALIEFTRAYELVPNYRVLYNIAQVGIQLGQYASARRSLQEYMEKGGSSIPDERREAVARDLEMLERRTAFLEITVNVPGAEVLLDDVVVGKTPLDPKLLVDAGVHRVVVRRPGYLQRNARVTLAGGDQQTLALTLDKQPEAKPTIVVRERAVREDDSSTLMIAGWVTTGALTAGAIVTGIMGAGEAKELDQLKAADPRDYSNLGARLDSTKSNASSLFLASDVFSGAAVIVGGLSLWITVSPPSKSSAPAAEQPAPAPGRPLQVGYDGGQIKLRGGF